MMSQGASPLAIRSGPILVGFAYAKLWFLFAIRLRRIGLALVYIWCLMQKSGFPYTIAPLYGCGMKTELPEEDEGVSSNDYRCS
jgi:hypothetical protein